MSFFRELLQPARNRLMHSEQKPNELLWEEIVPDVRGLLLNTFSRGARIYCSHNRQLPDTFSGSDERLTEFQKHCLSAVWQCLLYHWERQSTMSYETLKQTVESLSGSTDAATGRQIMSNPATDVVLAHAVAVGDETALRQFQMRFSRLAASVAADWHLGSDADTGPGNNPVPALLQEFCADVFANPRLLTSYKGKSPLGGWLRTTLARRIARKKAGSRLQFVSEDVVQEPASNDNPDVSAASTDCEQLLTSLLAKSLRRLGPEDLRIITDYYLNGKQNKDIAEELRLSPGQISRRRQDAIESIRVAVSAESSSAQDCAEYLLAVPSGNIGFTDRIFQLLNPDGASIP